MGLPLRKKALCFATPSQPQAQEKLQPLLALQLLQYLLA
jgi:hypothetical protein